MAKLKIDENLPNEVAALLLSAGHDAMSVLDQQLNGQPDLKVADVCRDEFRAIITLDLDFADIRTYPPGQYSGLIVLRLPRQDKPRVLAAITRLLPLFTTEPLAGKLWIVEDWAVRIRE